MNKRFLRLYERYFSWLGVIALATLLLAACLPEEATPAESVPSIPDAPTDAPPTETVAPATPADPTPDEPTPDEPTPLPELYSPLLNETVRRPPADEPPAPPPVRRSDSEEDDQWLLTTLRAATDLVNWAEGDPDAVLAQIENWGDVDDFALDDDGALPSAWLERVDLTQDGQSELLFAFPVRQEFCYDDDDCHIQLCFAANCPAYLLLFIQADGLYVPAHLFTDPLSTEWQNWLDTPSLFHVGDATGDGQTELLIRQEFCGAHTCYSSLLVGHWDGAAWHYYGSMGQSYTEISLRPDAVSDVASRMEIHFYGGMVGSAGAGLQRPHTDIYRFVDGQYQLIESLPDPDEHPYYLVLDAHAALERGAPARAYDLATAALANLAGGEEYMFLDDWSRPRIAGLAHIQRMLVAALDDDRPAMRIERDTIFAYPDTPYAAAAQTLLDVYEETADPIAACTAMDAVLQEQPEESSLFDWFGYNTEILEQYCPLGPGPSP